MGRIIGPSDTNLPKDIQRLNEQLKAERAAALAFNAEVRQVNHGREDLKALQGHARDCSHEDMAVLLIEYGHLALYTSSGKLIGKCLDWIASGTAQDLVKQKLVEDYIKKTGIFTPRPPSGQGKRFNF